MGIRCADHVTPLYPQKLTLTSPTGGGHSVGIVRSRTKATEFSFYLFFLKLHYISIFIHPSLGMGWNTVFGIATRHGLYSSRQDFLRPSILALGPTQPPLQWVPGLFPRGKVAGAWRWNPPHLALRLKKEYNYASTPFWAFMIFSRMNFNFLTFTINREEPIQSTQ